jgi:hypothetical protein
MRYQVPQFVDIEDKIIGPLTLRQFLTYVVAVMLLVPVYLAADMSLFITLAIPVLGVAALFAHFRLHGRTLFAIIGHASAFLLRGQLFVWHRVNDDKNLPVRGEEIEEYVAVTVPDSATLRDRARALETVGNVVNADADDPIVEIAKP